MMALIERGRYLSTHSRDSEPVRHTGGGGEEGEEEEGRRGGGEGRRRRLYQTLVRKQGERIIVET